jgi:ketosteroid isomerase-like protein
VHPDPDPATAADHLAILGLLGRYARAVSDHDPEAMGATWTSDAHWEVPGDEPVTGRAAIVELFDRIRSLYAQCVQQMTSHVIEVDGDTATGWIQIRELQWRDDGTTRELIGTYHDEYARTAAGWRFSRRTFHALARGASPLPPLRRPRA